MTTAVAIALYNGELFVEKQLDTLKNQTKQIDKVILCDDGSSDNTVNTVKEYISKNNLESHWTLVVNEKNLGFIKNFYKAMDLCDCDLIFLGDQDDIWELDKIQKMDKVMQDNPLINLLSCEYGIIDSAGEPIKSFLERKKIEDEKIYPLDVINILRAWQRPGMTMCVRRVFFDKIYADISKVYIPHDFALALCAADDNSFYVYNYIGAYHRRHNNNAAREEHRIFKLLDLERKLNDIKEWINYTDEAKKGELPISSESQKLLSMKLEYLKERYRNLNERRFKQILKAVKTDANGFYRKVAIVCDLWIVMFGNYKNR